MSEAKPKFIQGAYSFAGSGYDRSIAVGANCKVAFDAHAQPVYLRGGNSSEELIVLALTIDGTAVRLFPVGAKSAVHVPLAVVEDIAPDSLIEITISAPAGCSGTAVIDFGIVEI